MRGAHPSRPRRTNEAGALVARDVCVNDAPLENNPQLAHINSALVLACSSRRRPGPTGSARAHGKCVSCMRRARPTPTAGPIPEPRFRRLIQSPVRELFASRPAPLDVGLAANSHSALHPARSQAKQAGRRNNAAANTQQQTQQQASPAAAGPQPASGAGPSPASSVTSTSGFAAREQSAPMAAALARRGPAADDCALGPDGE